MKNYELLYILPASETSEEVVKNFKDVQSHIEKFGATMLETLLEHPFLAKTGISKEEEPEALRTIPVVKKKLAYAIRHEKFGFYCLINFQAEENKIKEIDEYLRHNANVLRHIVVAADPMTKEELELLQTLFARKKAEQEKEEAEKENSKPKEESRKIYRKIEEKEEASSEAEKEPAKETEVVEETEKNEQTVEKETSEKAEEVEAIKTEKEVKKTEEKAEEKKVEKEEAKKEEKKPKKSKIKLEELEDKLDAILEDTIV